MDRSTLQHKLNQPYTTDNWREIVQHVFPNVQIFSPPQVIPVNNDKVETFRQLGNVTLQDGKTLALFELKLKPNVNILRNRVELNTIVSQYIDQERTHGVLSIFEQGTDDYRFTFSARATEYDEESGDFNTKKTDTKRYTYVLGRNESCKTPATRFAELAQKKSTTDIQSIQDAFSVEKLSKEFFKEYKAQYQRIIDYLLATDAYRIGVFKEKEKKVRDFVKLLMGRLVFIQFVQKKRWMGIPADIAGWHDGQANFLYQSFLDFQYKDTFYSAFLEPLFYDTLNTPNRPGDLFVVTGTKVPYLNGGLFEKGEMDTSLINLPEIYFTDLLEFFDRYNFTIDENDPNEHEVGIDPEMLGHIFENLLEDNKDKGAFYTPKEIVHYMCQESLKEYLKTQLEAKGVWPVASDQAIEMQQSLEAFVKRKEAAGIIDHDGILAQALRDVKICDPAIGSGAFPMGLLTEIFRCMYVLYYASPDTVGEIWDMEDWQPETVKKNIIQNSIYGVDIEKGAVDIARLRFWLSLIVDEPEPHALPNLDYKIVVGNSLVSKLDDALIDIDWEVKAGAQSNVFGIANVERRKVLLQAISSKQKVYFDPSCDKETIGHEIRDLKIDLLINQLEEMINTQGVESQPTGSGRAITQQTERYLKTLGWKQSIQKLEAIKADREAHLHFFDWKLDFPEVMNEQVSDNAGFDIVIANPPYIGQKGNKSLFEPLSGDPNFEKKMDYWYFFLHKSYGLSKDSGINTFITPNYWITTQGGKKLRKKIIENYSIIEYINFNENAIFEAGVHTNIFLLKKNESPNSKIKCTIYQNKYSENIFSHRASELNFYADQSNIFSNWTGYIHFLPAKESGIIKQLFNNCEKLSDNESEGEKKQGVISGKKVTNGICNINQGLVTGKDRYIDKGQGINSGVFILTKEEVNALELTNEEKEFIKPFYKNSDIRKFRVETTPKYYFLYVNKIESESELKRLKNIFKHLNSFKDILSERSINGVLQSAYQRGKWWALTTDRPNINFESEKILCPQRSNTNTFGYSNEEWFAASDVFYITSNKSGYDLKYILTILASKLTYFWLYYMGKRKGEALELTLEPLQFIPIKKIPIKEQKPFVLITDYVLFLRDNTFSNINDQLMPTYFEQIIDGMVYELYFPELIKKNKREIIQYLGDLPEFTDKMSDEQKMKICKTVFNRLNEREHPVRVNLFYMNSTPEIAIIEGKNENN